MTESFGEDFWNRKCMALLKCVYTAQCYKKYDFGFFQKSGHRESRTLHRLKLQITRIYFTDIPTFSVPGLGKIQTIKFRAFLEILTHILFCTYRLVNLKNKFFRNDKIIEDIKDISNFCPNFESPFLWNKSMKIIKSFLT